MASQLEYPVPVRCRIPAYVAVCGLLLLPTLASITYAQINGTPSSVTSPGFGGRAVNGAPASVTSLGPRGYPPHSGVIFSTTDARRDGHRRHRTADGYYPYGFAYAVPVPYAVDTSAADSDYNDPDGGPEYQGGPTIFDRRGPGAEAYISPTRDSPPARSGQSASQNANFDPPAPDPSPEPTLLLFKDGHRIEIDNYAIVGPTLFDLTPGHPRKVALTDLDLDATQMLNDDRGVTFQLPPTAQAN